MHEDPARYWQDLTDNYAQMSAAELLELADKPEDLTEVAQQVLRDEMGRRRLDKRPFPAVGRLPVSIPRRRVDLASGDLPYVEDDAPKSGVFDEDLPTHEYTWKTWLCDCESNQHAWQIAETLKRHGIESWVKAVHPKSIDTVGPQVEVAADQLDQAQAVIAQPIPQDIIEDVNAEVPEFQMPICPQCGLKDDVMLAGADPLNTWLCEACGAEWTDPEPEEEKGSAT